MGILDALGQFRATVDTKVRQPTLRARNNLLQELQLDALNSAEARQRKLLAGSTGRNGVLSQFGPETAAQIGQLLQSGDATMSQLGTGLLGQLLGAKMAPKGIPLDERMMTPQQRVSVGDQRSQFQQSFDQQAAFNNAEEARRQQLFPGQMARQNLGLRADQLQVDALNRAANPPPLSQGQNFTEQWQQQTGAKLPKNMRVAPRLMPDGSGAFLDVQPVEGTPAYDDALGLIRGGEEAVEMIDGLLDDLALYGTEFTGAEALKMRQKRDRIAGNYGQLLKLGVLQPGDLERLDSVLPDPTTFGRQLNPGASEAIAAVYEQLKEQTTNGLQNAREAHWYIPTKPVTPQEQAAARKSRGR